jgi:hypothetical protein
MLDRSRVFKRDGFGFLPSAQVGRRALVTLASSVGMPLLGDPPVEMAGSLASSIGAGATRPGRASWVDYAFSG